MKSPLNKCRRRVPQIRNACEKLAAINMSKSDWRARNDRYIWKRYRCRQWYRLDDRTRRVYIYVKIRDSARRRLEKKKKKKRNSWDWSYNSRRVRKGRDKLTAIVYMSRHNNAHINRFIQQKWTSIRAYKTYFSSIGLEQRDSLQRFVRAHTKQFLV